MSRLLNSTSETSRDLNKKSLIKRTDHVTVNLNLCNRRDQSIDIKKLDSLKDPKQTQKGGEGT